MCASTISHTRAAATALDRRANSSRTTPGRSSFWRTIISPNSLSSVTRLCRPDAPLPRPGCPKHRPSSRQSILRPIPPLEAPPQWASPHSHPPGTASLGGKDGFVFQIVGGEGKRGPQIVFRELRLCFEQAAKEWPAQNRLRRNARASHAGLAHHDAWIRAYPGMAHSHSVRRRVHEDRVMIAKKRPPTSPRRAGARLLCCPSFRHENEDVELKPPSWRDAGTSRVGRLRPSRS